MEVMLTSEHHSLTLGKRYSVLGIEADSYRILNDDSDPYLYSPSLFEIADRTRPMDWIVEYGDAGEEYAYPPVLNPIGFFEDYFDDHEETRKAFWEYVNSIS